MNDQLQAALLSLVDDIQAARDFSLEQAPDVVQQMVAYEATMGWMGVVAGAVLFLLAAISAAFFSYAIKNDKAGMLLESSGVMVVLFISGSVVMAENLPDAVRATFYPKWFIVERIMQLLGG